MSNEKQDEGMGMATENRNESGFVEVEAWIIDDKRIEEFKDSLKFFSVNKYPRVAIEEITKYIDGVERQRKEIFSNFNQWILLVETLLNERKELIKERELLDIEKTKSIITNLESTINRLENELYSKESELEKAIYNEDSNNLRKENKILSDKYKNLKLANDAMCEEVRQLSVPENELIDSLNEKISALNEVIKEKEEIIKGDVREIKFLKKSIASLKAGKNK